MRWMKVLFSTLLISLPFGAAAEPALLMAEEAGCIWCARWNKEVGDAYAKTDEGRAAPLQSFDIHEGAPEGVTLARRVIFTPTFILVRDGQEVDRIEGYPGEDFFWGLLGIMLEKADISLGNTG